MDCGQWTVDNGLWTMDCGLKKGFTLVEVMVATAILAFGLVMVFQSFLVSTDTYNYYLNCLKVQLWLDEKIWRLQDDFRQYEFFSPMPTSGEFIIGNKKFNWDLNYGSIVPEEVYKIDLRVSWQQGSRTVNLLRVAYVSNFVPKQVSP